MIKNIYKLLVFCLLPASMFLAGACSPKGKKTEQLSRLDTLEMRLKEAESALVEASMSEIAETHMWCKDQLEKIHARFRENALSVDEKLLLDFEQLTLSMNRLSNDLGNIENEIRFARQKINEWKVSIEKSEYDTEEFMQYYQNQNSALNSLNSMIDDKTLEWQTGQENLKAIQEKVKQTLKK